MFSSKPCKFLEQRKYFTDSTDEREFKTTQITKQQVALPYNQLIGHRSSKGGEIRRMSDMKCTNLNAKLLKAAKYHSRPSKSVVKNEHLRFEDYKVYSAFKTRTSIFVRSLDCTEAT